MSILPVYIHPHPVLSTVAQPVPSVDDTVRQLMDDLLETLYNIGNGAGLSANQVGVLQRVLVMDCRLPDENGDYTTPNPIKMANPEIIWASEELSTYHEGCFSVPLVFKDIERPASVHVKYLDENNTEKLLKTGPEHVLLNHCIQHEIDHLDGIVFPERLSKLKQEMLWKRYRKLENTFAEDVPYNFIQED